MTVSLTSTVADIRPAAPCDEDAVAGLFAALHAFNAGLDERFALSPEWRSVLAQHLAHERDTAESATFLAWREGCPLGLAMVAGHTDSPLFRHRHWAEVLALYVTPEMRGHGVADELIGACVGWALARGYGRLQLFVTASNAGARRFYDRQRFAPIQEVWCRTIAPEHDAVPADPDCEAAYGRGEQLLAPSGHAVHGTEDFRSR